MNFLGTSDRQRIERILSRAANPDELRRNLSSAISLTFYRPRIYMISVPVQDRSMPGIFIMTLTVDRGVIIQTQGKSCPLRYSVAVRMWDKKTYEKCRKITKAVTRKMVTASRKASHP